MGRLSRQHERAFLETVGPIALQAAVLAEKARRSRAKQGAPERHKVRRPVMPKPSIGEPTPAPLQPALEPPMEREQGTQAPVADEAVAIDVPVCSDNPEVAVFASTIEPKAARTARGRNLLQWIRDWLRRAA
jgi:8-oxo-dGTP diphosphatase